MSKRPGLPGFRLNGLKTLYTILFFADTLALVLFSYFFLKLSDRGIKELSVMALLCGVIACIIFLIHIIVQYVKLPVSEPQK